MNRIVSVRRSLRSGPNSRGRGTNGARQDGPLTEYSSLRAELLQLSQQMSNLFVLHVGAAGSILSVSLTSADKRYVALVLPVVSYLICTRYFYLYQGILTIARYIREELSGRVDGGLAWEGWLDTTVRTPGRKLRQGLANLVTFVGIPLLAWVLATPDSFAAAGSPGARIVRLAAWDVSLVFLVMTYLTIRRARQLRQ